LTYYFQTAINFVVIIKMKEMKMSM